MLLRTLLRRVSFKKGVNVLPNRRSAIKELRKNRTNRMHNLDIKTDLKKTIKVFQASIKSDDKTNVASNLQTVQKKLDKAAKRNIMHKNTVARRKSLFSKLANSATKTA